MDLRIRFRTPDEKEAYKRLLDSHSAQPLSDVPMGAAPKYIIKNGQRRTRVPHPDYTQAPQAETSEQR